MYRKYFNRWNRRKKRIHKNKKRPNFSEREVWFCHLGTNIGFEQDGSGKDFLRPAVVIKKFNNEVCWIVPLTRADKTNKYYFKTTFRDGEESTAILSQIKLCDAKRFKYKRGYIEKSSFTEMKKRLRKLLS